MIAHWLSQPEMTKKILHTDNEVRCQGAHRLYGAFSWRGLDPIRLAYNPCRPDDRFKLTASTFHRLCLRNDLYCVGWGR